MLSFNKLASFFILSMAVAVVAVSAESQQQQQQQQQLRGLRRGHGCQGSAGETYCPETKSCIRPWEENCPIGAKGVGFHGELTMKCKRGRCSDLSCDLFDYKSGVSITGPYVEDLTGEFFMPAGCSAICDKRCKIDTIPEPDVDGHGCKASAGYTYCPETNECIRFNENCPIDGGTKLTGIKELTCTKGARLSNLTNECTLIQKQNDGSSITLSGPYISSMDGKYLLPEGCSAIVIGCTTQNMYSF